MQMTPHRDRWVICILALCPYDLSILLGCAVTNEESVLEPDYVTAASTSLGNQDTCDDAKCGRHDLKPLFWFGQYSLQWLLAYVSTNTCTMTIHALKLDESNG